MEEKRCTSCGEIKKLTDYYRSKKKYRSKCKECHKKSQNRIPNRNKKQFDPKASIVKNARKIGVTDAKLINKYSTLINIKNDHRLSKQDKQKAYDTVLYKLATLTQRYNEGQKSIPIDQVDTLKEKYNIFVGLG